VDAALKAAQLAKAKVKPFDAHGLKVRITSAEAEGPVLTVNLAATRNGKPVVLPTPFLYHNPPIVHEGEEDHVAVLREIVAETVRVVWQP
jgi:hypothetical protein